MKKFILGTALLLIIAGVGIAGSAEADAVVDQTLSEATLPGASAPMIEAEDAKAEQIEGMEMLFVDEERVEVGACCFANCFEEWAICFADCGASFPCRQDCNSERQACTATC